MENRQGQCLLSSMESDENRLHVRFHTIIIRSDPLDGGESIIIRLFLVGFVGSDARRGMSTEIPHPMEDNGWPELGLPEEWTGGNDPSTGV